MSTPDPLPPPPPMPGPHGIPNHLIWAIVSTVFATILSMLSCCCLPLGLASGIPAIIFANKVNRLISFDDLAGARAASDKAKLWCWVTTGLAIFFALIFSLSLLGHTMGWIGDGDWREVMEEMQRQR